MIMITNLSVIFFVCICVMRNYSEKRWRGVFQLSSSGSSPWYGILAVYELDAHFNYLFMLYNIKHCHCFSIISEIRGETESVSGGGGPVLLRRVPVVSETNSVPGQTPPNGVIPSDITMMEPLLQDQAFQQQILQVIRKCLITLY